MLDHSRVSEAISLFSSYGVPRSSLADDNSACFTNDGKPVVSHLEHMSEEQAQEVIFRATVSASVDDVRLIAVKNLNFLLRQAMTVMEHDHSCILTEEHVLRVLSLVLF